MFRNSWIHPQEGTCMRSMLCFTCIGVSGLVGGKEKVFKSLTHQTVHTDACTTLHTANTNAFLRMNPRGSQHVEENRN